MSVSLPYGLRRCPTLPPHPPPEHQGEPGGLYARRRAGSLFAHCEPTFCAKQGESKVMTDERLSYQQESRSLQFEDWLEKWRSNMTVSLWTHRYWAWAEVREV